MASGVLKRSKAVGIKNGAAESGDVCNVARGEYLHVVLEKSRVAAHKTVDLNTARLSAVDDRTDGGVHSGCVSAGGKDRDFLKFFHFLFPSFLVSIIESNFTPSYILIHARKKINRKLTEYCCQRCHMEINLHNFYKPH